MGNVAVAGDLVGRVDNHHALGLGQDARRLAQHGRLADARPPEQQHALAAGDDVLDDVDRAVHGPADAAGQSDDARMAVADRRDAVQRAFDAGAVVGVELADARHDKFDILAGDLAFEQHAFAVDVARRRHAPDIEDHLHQLVEAVDLRQALDDGRRQGAEHHIQVVGDALLNGHGRPSVSGMASASIRVKGAVGLGSVPSSAGRTAG